MSAHVIWASKAWANIWFVLKWVSVFVFVLVVVPSVKQALFPDLMTRLEKMFRRSTLENCEVQIERPRQSWIDLRVESGDQGFVETEISEYVLRELSEENGNRIFFAHSINHNPDKSFYLTETKVWVDLDLKRILRLEVVHCGRLENKNGRVNYDGHQPVYECVTAVQRSSCYPTPASK